ncbi:hypothetical protein COCNU_06G017650 [Cocos nucifera]|uniref:Uncharacterized protein n=1 Tax=Cocos nucifera TaxID=13894 RepID=A0A8K0ICX4_COCNU|nr:hypothetical protein COCNU_06G017650 [Cocos nucifera]
MLQNKGLMLTVDIAGMTADPCKVRVDHCFIHKETHPTLVDTTIAHSSEAMEVSFIAGVQCEKEDTATKLVSLLRRWVKLEGPKRKPTEKGKAISYLSKTYKLERKKQQEGIIGEGSMILSTSESDADDHQFSILESITTAPMELSQSVKEQGDSPS